MTKRKRYRLSEPMLRADRPLYMGVVRALPAPQVLADGGQRRLQFLAINTAIRRLSVTVYRDYQLCFGINSDCLPEDAVGTIASVRIKPPFLSITVVALRGGGTGGHPPLRQDAGAIGEHAIRQRKQAEPRIIAQRRTDTATTGLPILGQ